jgi:hypothetical protein
MPFPQGFQVGLSKEEVVGSIGHDPAADGSQDQVKQIEKARKNYPEGVKDGESGNDIKGPMPFLSHSFQRTRSLLSGKIKLRTQRARRKERSTGCGETRFLSPTAERAFIRGGI